MNRTAPRERQSTSSAHLLAVRAIATAAVAMLVAGPSAKASWGPVDVTSTSEVVVQPISMTDGPMSTLNIIALLASIAIVYIAWQAWSARPRLSGVQEIPTTTPPDDLHPAYAGVITSGQLRDSQIEAIVLELIRRGAVALEPDARERNKVQLRIINPGVAEIPPEQAMLDILERRSTDGVVGYRSLRRMRNHWGAVRDQLKQDVGERGWINPSIWQTRLPFVLPGLLGLGLTVGLIVAAIASPSGWLVVGAFLVGVTSTLTLSIGNILPQTTVEGERAAFPWRGLRSGLAMARDEAHGNLDLDRLFPYIVAMGLAAHYDRYLRRAAQSGYIPSWIGRRARVQEWPEGWHTYWIALHTALAPTDPANTTAPTGSPWRRSITGGR